VGKGEGNLRSCCRNGANFLLAWTGLLSNLQVD
jgi:hypothetical protein